MAFSRVPEEITVLSKFDDEFHATYTRVNYAVSALVREMEQTKVRLYELKKRRNELVFNQRMLINKIQNMRDVARTVVNSAENDNGEFGGYDSDSEFDYGTRPSIKAMVRLGSIKSDIKHVADEITKLYKRLDSIRQQITEKTIPYQKVLRASRTVMDNMSEITKQIAGDVFCWGKICCGVCIYHQKNKCVYGTNCRKAHVPIVCGFPHVRHHMYTDSSAYM